MFFIDFVHFLFSNKGLYISLFYLGFKILSLSDQIFEPIRIWFRVLTNEERKTFTFKYAEMKELNKIYVTHAYLGLLQVHLFQ